MISEKQNKDKKENKGPLVSHDVPTKPEYSVNYIKPKRPKNKKSGIVLEDLYVRLIKSRKKKEIISTENFKAYVGKEILLCGRKIYGSIILNEPMKLDRELLKKHSKRHLITDSNVDRLWPNENTFYSYSFRINEMFKTPIKYTTSTGFGITDNIEFENKTGASEVGQDNKVDTEKEVIKEPPVQEDLKVEEILQSNSRLDKYYNKLNSLKALEFGGKYKEIASLFLALYELYFEKGNGKIYDKDGVVLKPAPETPGNYIRIRIRNPRTMVEGSFRTITISKEQGIKGIIAKLKKDPKGPTHIQAVLFDKEKWTTARAVAWVKDHREDLKSLDSDKFKEIEKSSPKKVEVKEKIKTEKIWICPHCNEEIGEKELYCGEKTDEWFHRPCIEEGPIELPDDRVLLLSMDGKLEKRAEQYITDDYILKDKDTGKQEEKWVFCKNCKEVFDYYKQLIDDKSTLICPNCGALVIYEEK